MTVACFGEILLRMTAPGRELMLQKPHLDVYVAGAEANVGVGLANLGHPVRMVTCLPDNALGDAALREVRRHGVDVSGIARTPGRMGLYFLTQGAGLRASEIFYDRRDSSFARAGPGDFDWDALLAGADLLHLSGITPALGPRSAEAAVAAAEAAGRLGVPISFDGNYRAQLWEAWDSDPKAILTRLVSKARILFGNHRDISLLLGKTFGGEGSGRRREAAEAAFAAFPNLRMIASTARHVEDADRHRIAARIDTPDGAVQTEEAAVSGIVDRIGAGDAFAAGILHGVRTGRDLDWTVRSGLALTALKHSLPGDFSLFGPRDIEAFMTGGLDVRR
ncbi:MAG: sugar kinase [Alphaproteobacteria bacterium]|nr:sugar kinase [Alphaproteobacteria bacterium]MBV9372083.1 sugar kinase [Alphaproteobacteria bacterium]MBV9901748.1 sugar kinase [Alphaproteobacteria bacterium]